MPSLACETFGMVKQHPVMRRTGRAAVAGGVKRNKGGVNGSGGVWAAEKVALVPAAEMGLSRHGL